jgi:endonuclease-3 related protein
MKEKNFQEIYEQLFEHYGPQHWWPADTDFEMMISAILVQNTNWRNVEKALEQLRPYLTPQQLDRLPKEEIAQFIRSSGYYNRKAERIKSFLSWLKNYHFHIDSIRDKDKKQLREELLQISGIGKETADSILLYVFNTPIFIVDAYAKRIFYRLGHDLPDDYDSFRQLVEKELPQDVQLYNEFHALLVQHAKTHCKSKPICDRCPLFDLCKRRV